MRPATRIIVSTGMAKPMPCAGADRHVDADQFTMQIQQGTAGIAGIDAGVRLNQRFVRHFLIQTDIAADGTDDAYRNRMLVAVGIADSNDRFTDHQIAGCAEWKGRQRMIHIDLEQSEIALRIPRHDVALAAVPSASLTRMSETSSTTC